MKNVGYYIDSLKKQKQKLATHLNNNGSLSDVREPFETLVNKTEYLGYADGKPVSFCSAKDSITITLKGTGLIYIYGNNSLLYEVILKNNSDTITINNPTPDNDCCYWFNTLTGIDELDISNNEIINIAFMGENNLNKLIAYNNNIVQLNCKNCKNLQFLHIFNNPLCDNDEYQTNLNETINSLPDRKDTSIGSIILYPWYGLETLICNDNGVYRKYPMGTFKDSNNYEHPMYNSPSKNNNLLDTIHSVESDRTLCTVSTNGDIVLKSKVGNVTGAQTIIFPIRHSQKLINKTVTLSGTITSSNENINPSCRLLWKINGAYSKSAIELTAPGGSVTKTVGDPGANVTLYVLLYINTSGTIQIDDTVTFSNLKLTCEDDIYAIDIIDNKLYGVVDSDNLITYYKGQNNQLIEQQHINRHHSLRKILEKNYTLAKNWLFGSAIQYHDDYNLCYYHFKQSNVQDMWETAEKGFGMCIGSIDQYTGTNPDWADMNIKGYFSDGYQIPYTESHTNWSYTTKDSNGNSIAKGYITGEWSHGDFILSQLAGRGGEIGYGICPNAEIFQVDLWHGTGYISGNRQTELEYIKTILHNCNSYSASYIDTRHTADNSLSQQIRYAFGKFGEQNISTIPAGNDNNGAPWASNTTDFTPMYGNYGYEHLLSSLDNPSTTFIVPALRPNNIVSEYSNSSMGATAQCGGFTPEVDYISHYGNQIFGYHNTQKKRVIKAGTSMAQPNCNAILALMRIIYTKMHPECTSFGKYSPFMEYVKEHWILPLENNMAYATGMGMPHILAMPNQSKKLLTKFNGALLSSTDYQIGQPFSIISSITNDYRQGFTYDFNPKYYAQIDETTFIPIRNDLESSIDIYTNSATVNQPKDANYFTTSITPSPILYKQIELIENDAKLNNLIASLSGANGTYVNYVVPEGQNLNTITSFTVQFITKFTPECLISEISNVIDYSGLSHPLLIMKINENSDMQFMYAGLQIEDGIILPHQGNKNFILFRDLPGGPFFPPETIGPGKVKTQMNDIYVISVTFDNKIIKFYYNGTLIMYIDFQLYTPTMADIGVNSLATINQNINDVMYYDRVLSNAEIAQNTIALIQREEVSNNV